MAKSSNRSLFFFTIRKDPENGAWGDTHGDQHHVFKPSLQKVKRKIPIFRRVHLKHRRVARHLRSSTQNNQRTGGMMQGACCKIPWPAKTPALWSAFLGSFSKIVGGWSGYVGISMVYSRYIINIYIYTWDIYIYMYIHIFMLSGGYEPADWSLVLVSFLWKPHAIPKCHPMTSSSAYIEGIRTSNPLMTGTKQMVLRCFWCLFYKEMTI